MRQLLVHAAEPDYGQPAFNVNNLEQVQAIMEAAAETASPVIMPRRRSASSATSSSAAPARAEVKPVSLDTVATKYRSGELAQVVN